MRHDLLLAPPPPVAPRPARVRKTTRPAGLIALPRPSQRLTPGWAGAAATADAIAAAAANAADGTRPTSDLHASAEFREHLAKVLTKRAVAQAAGV